MASCLIHKGARALRRRVVQLLDLPVRQLRLLVGHVPIIQSLNSLSIGKLLKERRKSSGYGSASAAVRAVNRIERAV